MCIRDRAQAARKMDVDEYDQMLLGTIMVRLCNCGCARDLKPLSLEAAVNGDKASVEEAEAEAEAQAPLALPLQTPPPDDSLRIMSEILRGAHIVVEGDRGAFYSWFTQMQVSQSVSQSVGGPAVRLN